MMLWRFAFPMFCLLASLSCASAQTCTASVTLNFGVVDLTQGSAVPTSSTVSVTCSGTPGQTVRACPGIDATRQMVRNGAAGVLNYELYTDASHQTVWGTVGGTAPPAVDVSIDGGGNGNASRNIYSLILSAQTSVPTDNTHATYSQNPEVIVAAADATGNPTCDAIGGTNANGGTASVAAVYQPTCVMSAAPLAFGNIDSTANSIAAATSIQATCSATTPYSILLNGGLTGATDPSERMMQHGSDRLKYGLYRDAAHSQIWGDSPGVNVLGGSGIGSNQSINVYGLIPSQSTPPLGTYTDTVVVTIDY